MVIILVNRICELKLRSATMTRYQNKSTPSEPTIIAEQHRNPEGPTQQKEKQTNLEKKPPVASEPTIIAEQKRKPTKEA